MPPRKGPGYMSVRARPTSPHLQIYRWTVTMTMSILHRMTGIANYAGMALLAIWLGSAALGQDALTQVNYNEIIQVMGNPDHLEQGFIQFEVKGGRQ